MRGKNTRTRAADLRFHLYERSVHPELLEVIRRAEVNGQAFRAMLAITGQSHVLAVRAGGETLTEVVAPPDALLPRAGIRSFVELGRTPHSVVTRSDGSIRYRGVFRVETYRPAEYREIAGRILASGSFERIQAFFDEESQPAPQASVGCDCIPFALIEFSHRARRLEALSVHAYPYELTIVHVETRIDVGPIRAGAGSPG